MLILRRIHPSQNPLAFLRRLSSKTDKVSSDGQQTERKNKQTAELIHDIESKSPENNGSAFKDYINAVIGSENFKELKAEFARFHAERAKLAKEYHSSFSQKLDRTAGELRKSATIASKLMNDLTGYTRINKLKEKIVQNEQKMRDLRALISESKQEYARAVEEQTSAQKQINELLERKHNWSSQDLEKFTNLYRNGHELERRVQANSNKVAELEAKENDLHNELIQSIMERYHEEQVWSDKIRQFSTWGTIFIVCVNLLLMLLVQLLFEPWKRYRLLSSFESKVKELFETQEQENWAKLKSGLQKIEHRLDKFEHVEGILPADLSWSSIKHWATRLRLIFFSDKVYKLDVSSVELSAFCGAISSIFLILGMVVSRLLL
ncbi:hypothetical protein KL930_003470 [Ogataea haglerorum]|uniref:Sensitive to high expression protein 9, mitochondrial n=1 Tax=Ogataea haglerorum TaxID=1937702 RepID=A0ABQ7RFB4_9ASCO|nr:hypothetical protein KL915_002863 [Ogataea haglerorum]KAG7695802.1 hypothetical protein KL951_003327 [Ogataea haglerorum]KAG7718498.1 hypothetical protein KL913_002493 [Ogataea haglerorum]KAG7718653.1 hypothetical protein KL949_002649 [Ogataea haglerorum]KAG7757504.1 hypothetical protein KL947_003132 [Ogataea haglerorum]